MQGAFVLPCCVAAPLLRWGSVASLGLCCCVEALLLRWGFVKLQHLSADNNETGLPRGRQCFRNTMGKLEWVTDVVGEFLGAPSPTQVAVYGVSADSEWPARPR